jgi:small multidrug resistance family-3 protein
MKSPSVQLLVLVVAAALEVGGDAMIRAGLRGKGWLMVLVGFVVLGSYGIAINQLPLDFSKLLGAYVGFFALISVTCGWVLFGETIAAATWVGLGIVIVGSLVMQFGSPR